MDFFKKYKTIIIISILIILICGVFLLKQLSKNSDDNWIVINEENKSEERKYKFKLYELGMENCEACSYMESIVEIIKEEYKEKIDFEYVDVNRNSNIANKFRVSYVPLFVIVDENEKVISRKTGVMEIEEFRKFINEARGI